jgi:hypothetical protein
MSVTPTVLLQQQNTHLFSSKLGRKKKNSEILQQIFGFVLVSIRETNLPSSAILGGGGQQAFPQ